MNIGIIGTGNIGGTLARKLTAAGHHVRVANSKGKDNVAEFAKQIGATAADVHDAVNHVEVIILAIPLPAMRKLPACLFDGVAPEVTVIDTSNYYPGMRDERIAEIDQGMPESAWVSQQLERPVIKAFNNALAYTLANLGKLKGDQGRLALAVAGDDDQAKQIAMNLVDEAGFDPVDGGSLMESWRQQPSTPAYCCDWDADKTRAALASAVKGEAEQKRDQMPAALAKLGPSPTHEEVVAMNRRTNAPDLAI
jgi:predicted dinucleotide-binding enzyme